MQIVVICHEMKWDYYTFKSQPTWFIGLLAGKLEIDGDEQKKEQDDAERNARRKHTGGGRKGGGRKRRR